ncbi:hypothetical protein [Enterococcus sp. DIV0240a]|uniref:hypothetical protein n=1 Tax=unclassified Enterococcus TaxID=2608891 RepID=UPI003D29C479
MNEEQQTKEVLSDLSIAFIKMLGSFVILGISIALDGFTFSYLWNGVMPNIFGLPLLSFIQSVGIAVLINFATYRPSPENEKTLLQTFLHVVFSNLIFLFMGWVVMLFI